MAKNVNKIVGDAQEDLVRKQKESVRLQNDYNDALKVSASINKGIIDGIDDEIDYRTTLGKKVKDYNDELKSSISQLSTSEDVAKKLVQIEAEKERIGKSYFGSNRAVGQEMLRSLAVAEESLNIEHQRLAITEKVNDAATQLSESLSSSFDGLVSGASNIPVIGGLLGKLGNAGSTAIKDKLGTAAKSFVSDFAGGLRGGASTMEALSGAAGGLGTSLMAALTSPLVIIGLIVGALALGAKRFSEIDSAAKSFRDTTGLLNSQTTGLKQNIESISKDFATLGVSAEDVGKAAGAFTTEFSGIEQPSKAVLGSMVALNKNFGIGVEQGAQLNKVFQNIGGLTAEQSQALIGQTVQMAKMAGVAPGQVIKDMADSSEYAYRYFNGSPKALAAAAVQAAKLGTSIKQAGAVADGLLDFETSITSELEASAILGTNLNLSQARYLAANDDVLGAQQEVLNQVASLGDLTKLNKFEQEALAKATHMPMEDLINQQRIREQFGKLDKDQLASAMSLMNTGKDISKMTKSDLDAQTKKLAAQQEMQSEMDKLSNSTAGLGTGIMDMFAPAAAYLITMITDVVDVVSSLLMPAFSAIGSVLKVSFGILGAIWNVFMAILKPVFAIAGAIMENISEPLRMASDSLQPLFAKFAQLKDKVMAAVTPILPVFKFIGVLLGTVIGGAIDIMVDAFSAGFDIIFSIIEGVSDFFQKYLVAPLQWVIDNVSSVFSSIGSFLGFGGDSETPAAAASTSMGTTPTESVNDGVVQKGKVVGTDPADTLLATKDPGSLLETIATGLGTGIGGLLGGLMGGGRDDTAIIGKLDELIVAVQSNRDVYMDREKVSSAVVKTNEKSGENRFGLMGA
jgi:hypothetical protein